MTSNQIAFINSIEQQRANRAREAENRRYNDVNAALQAEANHIKWDSLAETQRYNQLAQRLEAQRLDESQRHDRAQERLSLFAQSEAQRHNQLTEQIESRRADVAVASQQEAARHNAAQEVQAKTNSEHDWWQTQKQAFTAQRQADIAQQQADQRKREVDVKVGETISRELNRWWNTFLPSGWQTWLNPYRDSNS